MASLEPVKARMQGRWRSNRMRAFLRLLRPVPGARVLDIGGTPHVWELAECDLEVTLFNLPGEQERWPEDWRGRHRLVEGDACEATPFRPGEFDIVFSNSVIEHVGGPERRGRFAETVSHLAPSYWVQTPSRYFPIEAHCHLPFWWHYPESLQRRCIRRWARRGEDFTANQMSSTTGLTANDLRALFPSALLYTERVAGLPKSTSVYRLSA